MTLRQQFSMLTTVLVIVLLMGSLALSIINGRDTFEQQLNARAYDAATSLALSMSQVPDQDEVELSRQIDALFDRGFFSDITFTAIDGTEVYRREQQALTRPSTPDWFKEMVPFELLPAVTDVTNGWQRLGTVTVISHTDFAYRGLWQMIQSQAIWFMFVLVLGLVLLQMLLRWLFQPVLEVEQQALAICERQWKVVEHVPDVLELKNMVLAMNKMVNKLHTMFLEQSATAERLRKESFEDEMTELLNRRGFDQRLDHLLRLNEEHSGLLLLMQIEKFSAYNLKEGRSAGDDAIRLVALELRRLQDIFPSSFCGRHAGADFTAYIPVANRDHANNILQQVFGRLASGVLNQQTGLNFHMGGVFLHGEQDTVGSALTRADEALRQAQQSPDSQALLYYQDYTQAAELSASAWSKFLKEVLEQGGLQLMFMPVLRATQGEFDLLQIEVYSRVVHQGQPMPAARFWPMVEQHQLSCEFDLKVLTNILDFIEHSPFLQQTRICANVSPSSILDARFQHQLIELLENHAEAAQYLALEVPEYSIRDIEAELEELAPRVRALGVQLGVDRVGTGSSAFAYMKRLPLDYLRIDGSINRGMHEAQDLRFYTQSMVQIGHKLDLQVFGEGLEQGKDIEELYLDGIDGISGFFYCKPFDDLKKAEQWISTHQ